MKRITVIVPVYNEEGNIAPLTEAVGRVFADLPEYRHEILFVDDGSTDGSRACIEVASKGGGVRSIELSRNFGKEAPLSAGLAHAEGDAVILMDADLQHPPEVIPELIAAWEDGADVVIGVRRKNPDESAFRALASKLFAHAMRAAGNVPTVRGATDFRLLDSRVVAEFARFTEHGRMTRGLIDWLGFRRA
jgi:dolichol-phosphate mannosyltransferase